MKKVDNRELAKEYASYKAKPTNLGKQFRIDTVVASKLASDKVTPIRQFDGYFFFEFEDNNHIAFNPDGYLYHYEIGDNPLLWLLSVIQVDYPQLVIKGLSDSVVTTVNRPLSISEKIASLFEQAYRENNQQQLKVGA